MTEVHMDPPPTPLIKSRHDDKSDKYFVKLKLRSDPTSAKSDLYEFKMDLYDNVKLGDFFVLLVTSKRLSRIRRNNIFVRLYMEKRYFSLNICLLKWKVQTL